MVTDGWYKESGVTLFTLGWVSPDTTDESSGVRRLEQSKLYDCDDDEVMQIIKMMLDTIE